VRAVDVECFAGGFTLGAAQAGFEVVAKRELPGGFGVPSVEVNRALINPALDIQVSSGPDWMVPDDIDLVFGNPPCSAFSGVSDKNFAGADNSINQCMFELIDFAARCNGGEGPPVIIYESVQNAFTRGRDLLRELFDRLRAATGSPYQLHHVLHNAYALGGCAERRRYFFVASRIPIGYASPGLAPSELPTLWSAIADLYDIPGLELGPQPYGDKWGAAPSAWAKPLQSQTGQVDGHISMPPQYQRQSQALLDLGPEVWREGESLTKALGRYVETHGRFPTMETEADEKFAAHYGPEGRNFNFGGAWQPERWRHDNPARVITGGSSARSIHPFAPRPFTLREQYRIQGFPDDWRLEPAVGMASLGAAMLWPGKGIPVSSGRWVASMAMNALQGSPVDDGKLEQVGENEYVWNGTNDHKPKKKPAAKRRAPAAARDATTREKKTMTTETDPILELVQAAFAAGQPAMVQLTGDKAQDKRRRELLYTAAYKLGGKVKVRTNRADQTATGIYYLEGQEPPTLTLAPAMIDVAAAFVTSGAGVIPHESGRLSERPPAEQTLPAEPAYGEGSRHTGADGTAYELHYRDGDWHWDPLPAAEPGVLSFPDQETDGVADVPVMEQLEVPLTEAEAEAAEFTAPLAVAEAASESVHDLEPPVGFIEEAVAQHALDGDDDALAAALDASTAAERQFDLQPKTSAREVKDRRFDLTQLRAGSHGYYVHRDYASHYFRWGWATRMCGPQTRLLEVGCGQDLPLTRVFIYHNGIPAEMVSVDLNKIKDHVQPKWFTLYDETNFLDAQPAIIETHGRFDVVSCFEVIEHMPREDGITLLERLRDSVTDDGFILLSTPVFNGKAAANHIHEWYVEELRVQIETADLEVVERYGTFASYHDVKRGLTEHFASLAVAGDLAPEAAQACLNFYERLREFYSDDVLANFMAPNLPDHSRNNVWKLRRAAPVGQQLAYTRTGANKWEWRCPSCGFNFERTSQESLEGFAPNHLTHCDGPGAPVVQQS
jgi:site-specific DNA-cytosine methylase